MELKGVLNADRIKQEAAVYAQENALDEDDDADQLAEVVREMMRRRKQPNLASLHSRLRPNLRPKKFSTSQGPQGTPLSISTQCDKP